MADIQLCTGKGCILKAQCRRYTTKSTDKYQYYFKQPPYKFDGCSFKCEHRLKLYTNTKQ